MKKFGFLSIKGYLMKIDLLSFRHFLKKDLFPLFLISLTRKKIIVMKLFISYFTTNNFSKQCFSTFVNFGK